MTVRRTRPYAALLGVVAVLVVGACSGDGDDPATPTTSSSSSSTTSGTTTSPSTTSSTSATATIDPADLPPEAQKHTPEGAAAFAKYYMQQVNEAWTAPDDAVLPSLSDPGCLSCKDLQETAEQLVRDKQHYTKSPVTVTKAAPLSANPDGVQLVRLFMDQHKVDVIDASGKVVLTDQAKKLARTVGLKWGGRSWLLYDIGQ